MFNLERGKRIQLYSNIEEYLFLDMSCVYGLKSTIFSIDLIREFNNTKI